MIINLSKDLQTSMEKWRYKAEMNREFARIEVKKDMRLYLQGKAQAYDEIADDYQGLIDKLDKRKVDE